MDAAAGKQDPIPIRNLLGNNGLRTTVRLLSNLGVGLDRVDRTSTDGGERSCAPTAILYHESYHHGNERPQAEAGADRAEQALHAPARQQAFDAASAAPSALVPSAEAHGSQEEVGPKAVTDGRDAGARAGVFVFGS